MTHPIWQAAERPEMTLKELSEKTDIWKGTIIPESDIETRENLLTYFSLDRLCDNEERFLWFWKRNLLLYYPIYKNQLEMWKERMAYKWFYDNFKEQVTTHDGKFALEEDITRDIVAKIDKTIKDIYSGNIDSTRNFDGTLNSVSHDEGVETNQYIDNSNGKARNFNFQYPEANYQGGVIPYDLDNNPSVEFIDNQSDAVNKNSVDHKGSSDFSNDGTRKDNTKNTETTNTDTNSTNDRTDVESQNKGETEKKGRGEKTDWTETVNRQGDNINELAEQLIAQLPFTNFFEQFVGSMRKCFRNVYIDGEEQFYYG